jgi:hypothetical protein
LHTPFIRVKSAKIQILVFKNLRGNAKISKKSDCLGVGGRGLVWEVLRLLSADCRRMGDRRGLHNFAAPSLVQRAAPLFQPACPIVVGYLT